MEDLIIEFNALGVYTKIAPTNDNLLFVPRDELLGKSLHEIFSKDVADFFMRAIIECLKTKKTVSCDYRMKIKDVNRWFHARLSYINDNAVIFVAHDDTERRKNEEALVNSEKKLKQLNATKDKLFSVIAHDLRSPFHPILSYSEILDKELDSLNRDGRKTKFS